jgi:hypothetical protein
LAIISHSYPSTKSRQHQSIRNEQTKISLVIETLVNAAGVGNREAEEAVERFLNYDEWLSREVDKGLAAADRGEFVEHDDIRKMIDSRYPA